MRLLSLLFFLLLLAACSPEPSGRVIKDLNANWEFRQAGTEEWMQANVPGYAQSDLIELGKIEDPWFRKNEEDVRDLENQDWEYRLSFYVFDADLANDRADLLFEGLDTYADVYLNDSLVITADNMFRAWKKEVKSLLKKGDNELRVYIHSPVKKGLEKLQALPYILQATSEQAPEEERTSIHTRKAPFHYGWDWGPRVIPSGIWRPVTLTFSNVASITDTYFKLKELTDDKASYTTDVEIRSESEQTLQFIFKVDDTEVEVSKDVTVSAGVDTVSFDFNIPDPELWWTHQLGTQHRYDVSLLLKQGTDTLHYVEQKLGVRSIELVQEEDVVGHSFYFKLNGVPVFMKGANYIPTDYFVANQTREDYEKVIRDAVDVNMNMLRVWGGAIYENEEFYELCDEYGIMVWQDFMFACAVQPIGDLHLENIKAEAEYNVRRLRKHPSMALWCGNNENLTAWIEWGWKDGYEQPISDSLWHGYEKIFYQILDDAVAKHHPELGYHPSSPTTFDRQLADVKSGDEHNWEIWFGDEPIENYEKHLPRFSSEYGMQAFPDIESLEKFTDPATDFEYRSEVFEHRQRSRMEWFAPGMNGNEMIRRYIDKRYQFDGDFADYVYLSQVNQAEALQSGAEAHRRNKPITMGSLFWQINDCWPAVSWSTVDYYGNWKAAHHFIKKAYADLLVSPVYDGDRISVTLVSDLTSSIEGELSLKAYDFNGNLLSETEIDVEVKANSSDTYYNSGRILMGVRDKRSSFVMAQFESSDGSLRSSNVVYLDLPKNLKLAANPTIETDIQPIVSGYKVKVRSNQLVKNLRLRIPGIEGRWSDNYFDLLPGKSQEVYFSIPQYTPGLEDSLELFHMGQVGDD